LFHVNASTRSPRSAYHVSWLAALQKALAEAGSAQIPKGKALCEVKGDGTIVVKNAVDGKHFFIRPIVEHAAPPKRETRESARAATSFPTITYLEAELQHLRAAKAPPVPPPPPKNPTNPAIETAGHPCMTFNRAAIDRRLREYRASLTGSDALSEPLGPLPPAAPKTVPGEDRPVRFIKVVDVYRNTRDTLTTLRVDLDALRAASDQRKVGSAKERTVPEGFAWLDEPLESALTSAVSVGELADRTLRLALAAVPSKVALFLLKTPDKPELKVVSVVGGRFSGQDEIALEKDDVPPLSALASGGVSMALEGSSGQFSTDMLASLLDETPRNALLAAITNGKHTLGGILLAESLATPRYSTLDLSVANYIAGRVYQVLCPG
jgi:hypothetical protein